MTRQQISAVTLGVADLARARRFYGDGFGWTPVFENDEIVFYQMNGLVLGLYRHASQEDDMRRANPAGAAPFALSHNVAQADQVQPLLDRLVASGGMLLRAGDAPSHGGFRGYAADPDGHAWEIAFNPAWTIDTDGKVAFSV